MVLTNQTNPLVNSMHVGEGTGIMIYSGSATTSPLIDAETGSPNIGDLYLSTNGSGEIWFAIQSDGGNTWTKLTIT